MAFFRRPRYAIARRLFVVAALSGFLAGTLGVPVFVTGSGGKDQSQPYPCMNHACGCQSAEACWRGCCCFTMAQKLAWAEANGVTPPAFVVVAAKREAKAASCCEAKSNCCAAHNQSSREDIDCCSTPARASDKGGTGFQIGFVLADASRKCQGQAQLWLSLGAVMLTPHVECSIDLLPAGEVTLFGSTLPSLSLRPAVPPPRSA